MTVYDGGCWCWLWWVIVYLHSNPKQHKKNKKYIYMCTHACVFPNVLPPDGGALIMYVSESVPGMHACHRSSLSFYFVLGLAFAHSFLPSFLPSFLMSSLTCCRLYTPSFCLPPPAFHPFLSPISSSSQVKLNLSPLPLPCTPPFMISHWPLPAPCQ